MSNNVYYKIAPISVSVDSTKWTLIGDNNKDNLGNLLLGKQYGLFVFSFSGVSNFPGDLSVVVELSADNSNNSPAVIFINSTTWLLVSFDNRTPYQQDKKLYNLGIKLNTGTLSGKVSFTKIASYNAIVE